MRFATPYNSFAPSMRAFSREYPMAVTSYADVQGEELSLFVGSRNLNHFDLQGLIDSATNVATKVANVVDKVQSYIPKSTSTPPLTSTQVQNGISPNTPAAQQDTWTKYKVPIIGGAALVILIVAILILAKK